METKICPKCNKEKYVTNFLKKSEGREERSWCKWCLYGDKFSKKYFNTISGRRSIKKRNDKALTKPLKIETRYNQAQNLARGNKRISSKSWNLTLDQYTDLINKPCYYCNNILCVKRNTPMDRGVGLDRIDNDKGYERENVLPCGGFCNITRGDRLSVEETKAVVDLIIKMRAVHIKTF